MSYKYMSKQELCNAIYETVMASYTPLTRLEIAQAICKKKSLNIIEMIEHLTNTGYFDKRQIIDKFGRQAFVYAAAKNGENACKEAA